MKSKLSIVWLILRIYLGYQWLNAGIHKVTGGFDASNFLKGAISKSQGLQGAKPIVQVWWANFLENFALKNVSMFNILIPVGEILVGIALIVGFATLFAVSMGMIMNISFILSGTISTNPNLLAIEIILVTIAGAYAGYIGIDYWFRPWFRKKLKITC